MFKAIGSKFWKSVGVVKGMVDKSNLNLGDSFCFINEELKI